MNLYDLVLRRDRMVEAAPDVQALALKAPGGTLRAVRLEEGSTLKLRDAHEATALHTFPAWPRWSVHGAPGAVLDISIEAKGVRTLLASVGSSPPTQEDRSPAATSPPRTWWSAWWRSAPSAAPGPARVMSETEVRLQWPVPVPVAFDLHLSAAGGGVIVGVGPLLDARARLLPQLRGHGVEVGPGRNPCVLAGPGRSVKYVEKMPAEQWAQTYAKAPLDPARQALWEDYVVDAGDRLDTFGDGSLDFVFSSHVIEHLVNPLETLECWWAKLAPGGVIAGVVPDARFTFDLRQPLTILGEFTERLRAGVREPTPEMYERWCRHTAPGTSPESLRERGYAIHVSYFSPESFRSMLDLFASRCGPVAGVFMESVANGKDFGFAVVKP